MKLNNNTSIKKSENQNLLPKGDENTLSPRVNQENLSLSLEKIVVTDRALTLDGPFNLDLFLENIKDIKSVLNVSPKALIESALRDLNSLDNNNLDQTVIANALEKTMFAVYLSNIFGIEDVPYGFEKVWQCLKTLSKPINSKKKGKNRGNVLGALPGVSRKKRKFLDEIYKTLLNNHNRSLASCEFQILNCDKSMLTCLNEYFGDKKFSYNHESVQYKAAYLSAEIFKVSVLARKSFYQMIENVWEEPEVFLDFIIEMGAQGSTLAPLIKLLPTSISNALDCTNIVPYISIAAERGSKIMNAALAQIRMCKSTSSVPNIKQFLYEAADAGDAEAIYQLALKKVEDENDLNSARYNLSRLDFEVLRPDLQNAVKSLMGRILIFQGLELTDKIELANKKWQQAIKILKTIDEPVRFIQMGVAFYYLNENQKSMEAFETAISYHVECDYEILFKLYKEGSKYQKIVGLYGQGFFQMPSHRDAIGDVYLILKNFNAAKKCYTESIKLGNNLSYYGLGYAYLHLNKIESAIKCFMNAIKVKNLRAAHPLADIMMLVKNHREAEKYYILASTLKDAVACKKLAELYYDQDRIEEAIIYYKKAIKYSSDKSLYHDLGMIYESQNRLKEASECFKKGGFKDDFRRVFTHIIENTSQDKSQEEEEKKEEYEYEGDAQTYQRIPLAPKKVREQNAERVNEAYKTSSSSSASHESSEGELKSYRDLTIEITPGIRGDMIVHEERIKELATFLANAEARAKFEFLKGDLIGFCSMRISDSDRMVFKILEGDINNGVTKIQIISVLGHYPKSHTYTQKEAFELYTFDELH